MEVITFTVNPIQEHTYIIYDETKECAIIDCGCLTDREKSAVKNFIAENGLQPKHLLNTHLHFDHALGNRFIFDTYGLKPEANQADEFLLAQMKTQLDVFLGKELSEEPAPIGKYLNEGDKVVFGNSELEVLHVPGHSPGSLVFYARKDNMLFAGDVLFRESIGRTDLPGGNYATLINGIKNKLLTLPDETLVFCGHDETTTIGHERKYNPYL
ncbi:MAG: MBL fold metallo-hydrolase [Prevotellaceae bacterium]|jgi:glyoxylase-like metal-dependent hydrolase (beta-lactamase superfamily II)|nr:MBL fold metallo-hydrolase [Prevotellaceae bacterium]